MPKTVWVATISHAQGVGCLAVCANEAGAIAAVADWCRQFWGAEGVPGDPPEDDAECSRRYFEAVNESGKPEEANVEPIAMTE